MIVVVAKNIVKKSSIEDFKQLTKELIEKTRLENGCIEYNLYVDKNKENVFTFIEKWESDDDLKKHTESIHFKKIVPDFKPLLESDGELSVYDSASEYEIKSNIFKRKSIRSFIDRPVEKEKIEKILKAAMQSPSAGNTQAWEFIVVTDKKAMKDISLMSPYAKPLETSALAIIVCGNILASNDFKDFLPQDLAACTENILLQIAEDGLGAVWLGFYPAEDRVNKLQNYYKLPPHIIPFAVIPLGYTDSNMKITPRYSYLKVHYDKY